MPDPGRWVCAGHRLQKGMPLANTEGMINAGR